MYHTLPQPLQIDILNRIKQFHHALRECGRSDDVNVRLAAMKLIALGRQGKLAYVLSENLHDTDETLSKAATEAMVALARWIATETRKLNSGQAEIKDSRPSERGGGSLASSYKLLMENRPEIESAVARAMDVHRGKHGQELLACGPALVRLAGQQDACDPGHDQAWRAIADGPPPSTAAGQRARRGVFARRVARRASLALRDRVFTH